MRTKVVSISFFPRAFKQKKIKALRPKMTKIASRGSCLKHPLSFFFFASNLRFLAHAERQDLYTKVASTVKNKQRVAPRVTKVIRLGFEFNLNAHAVPLCLNLFFTSVLPFELAVGLPRDV